VPIKKPVAGISCGLVTGETDDDYIVLTDIQGLEDFFGDMDFKVAGTHDGITAIQMDIKIHGLTRPNVEEAISRAKAAREYILSTIVGNYNPDATIIITTHLIADVEQVLDDFMFISYGGKILKSGNAEEARIENNCSLDELFREVFRCSQNF
jgi:hypothetical protein